MSDGPEAGAGAVTSPDAVSPAQSRAAHAYADVLLGAELAGPAAEDALAAFRQTSGGDETLLALTRLMTAVSLPDRSSPEDRRQAVWASIGATSHCTCREAAALLASRANNTIQPRESTALDDHLNGCEDCRELAARSVTADTAFAQALHPPRSGGGFAVPGMPRAAYAAAAVLVAVIVAVVALISSGSGRHTPAAAAAVPTQTVQSAATTTATTVAKPAVKHTSTVKRTRVRHKPVVKHHTKATAPVAHTATVSTPVLTTSASTVTPSSSAADVSTATAPTTPAPAKTSSATKATSASEGTHAPSTASQVSGSSSLPAESAPQQGIGTLTTPGN